MQNRNQRLRLFVLAAVFLALIFILTAIVQIPLPAGTGYIHLGDMMLYLAASMLPLPYAIAAASLGEALADVATGYAFFAPATLVIKAVMVLCLTSKRSTLLCGRNVVAVFGSGLFGVWAYYLYESIIYGSFVSPLAAIPMELLKVVINGVAYLVIAKALDSVRIKNHLPALPR